MNRIPYTKKDFVWTKWTPAEITKAANEVIAAKKRAYAAVKKIPASARTFENTVYAIEASSHPMTEYYKISLLMYVSPEAAVREAAQKALKRIERRLVELEHDEGIFRALTEYEAENERLVGPEKKLFEDMRRDFRRRGFGLPKMKRDRLKRNLIALSNLKNVFEKNLNDYRDEMLVGADELAGCPEGYVASLPRKNGKYVVTLDYPSLVPFMENAENEERRRELSEKNWRKGGKRNLKLLEGMIRLREENAQLLGYPTYADYRTENRMAKNADRVFDFLQKLIRPLSTKAKEEIRELIALKGERPASPASRLASHEVLYLASRLKKRRYDVDNETVREYFPLDHVKTEMFLFFGKLLGVSFERVAWKLWHPDAELYLVRNAKSGEALAYFAFDLFPREGKYGHACVANVVSGHEQGYGSGSYVMPFATLIANFPNPSKARPSLLSHDELETLFHEFGHLMHETLTEARFYSQSGFAVAWDFVEAMSQMCEFFLWEDKILISLSKHWKTGKPLPAALRKNIIASKRHMLAYDTARQAVQALYDMMLHSGNGRGTLPGYFRSLTEAHLGVSVPESSLFPAGFGHLAGGYDAGYYGYLWSRVYAADMFSEFRKAGIASTKVGARYRTEILARGSTRDEAASLREFLGRRPSETSFLEEIGVRSGE